MSNTVQVQTLYKNKHPRTLRVLLRLSMPNTVQVQVQWAFPRPRTYVSSVYRSGCPCQTLYTYTYSVHAQAHGLTYNRRIAQAVHAKHYTRTRTVCTPNHLGLCTTGVSLRLPMKHCPRTRTVCTSKHTSVRALGALLRLPMANIVQVQVKCAHPRSRPHVQRRHRSGCPCRPQCKYKYSMHAYVHASV